MSDIKSNDLKENNKLFEEQIYNYGNIRFIVQTKFRETGDRTLGDVIFKLIKNDIDKLNVL
jgi:hypothetical protein